MMLFRHKEHGELVVVGEKSVYHAVKRSMSERGFEYLGAFNASWGAFTAEFVQISSTQQFSEFIKKRPITMECEVRALRSKLDSLSTQFQKLKKELGE